MFIVFGQCLNIPVRVDVLFPSLPFLASVTGRDRDCPQAAILHIDIRPDLRTPARSANFALRLVSNWVCRRSWLTLRTSLGLQSASVAPGCARDVDWARADRGFTKTAYRHNYI